MCSTDKNDAACFSVRRYSKELLDDDVAAYGTH